MKIIFQERRAVSILLLLMIFTSCYKKVAKIPDQQKETVIKINTYPDTSGFWQDLSPPVVKKGDGVTPAKFRYLSLDFARFTKWLSTAPLESDKKNKPGLLVNIPMPDGTYQLFMIYETEVMAPELAAKFPEIKSFGGNGVPDKSLSIRMDYAPGGFHAMIITLQGEVFIDPYRKGEPDRYKCYYKHDFQSDPQHPAEKNR